MKLIHRYVLRSTHGSYPKKGIVFSSVADVSTVEERSPPVSDVGPASTYLDSFSYQNNQTPISAESSDGADIASEIDLSYSL